VDLTESNIACLPPGLLMRWLQSADQDRLWALRWTYEYQTSLLLYKSLFTN